MDARTLFVCFFVAMAGLLPLTATGAERHETPNFLVTAADQQVARQVATAAEHYRRELAVYWLGRPMPNWSRPCRVSVNVGSLGAGGQTTFQFVNGEVINWRMSVQGSLERILDSVIPHEVNHTIFACHFRRPLPRWADEGAATLFEHESEKGKQLHLLNQVIRDRGQHFSLGELLSMKDYPEDPRRMLTLYAQGFTLVDFLVQQKGQKVYLQLLAAAEERGWDEAIRTHFDHEGIAALERNWRGWVLAGRPRLLTGDETLLAQNSAPDAERLASGGSPEASKPGTAVAGDSSAKDRRSAALSGAVVRSQSPDAGTSPSSDAAAVAVLKGGTTPVARQPSEPASGAGVRRPTAVQGYRAASFEAPKPKRSGQTAESVQTTPAEESTNGAAWFEETRGAVEDGGAEANSSAKPRRDHFVPTGHANVQEDSERRDSADGTPPWAGFPGSAKLF
ncbi:MAG: hypothetical protein ACKO2P_18885 [Planctomycetota bacterium]